MAQNKFRYAVSVMKDGVAGMEMIITRDVPYVLGEEVVIHEELADKPLLTRVSRIQSSIEIRFGSDPSSSYTPRVYLEKI